MFIDFPLPLSPAIAASSLLRWSRSSNKISRSALKTKWRPIIIYPDLRDSYITQKAAYYKRQERERKKKEQEEEESVVSKTLSTMQGPQLLVGRNSLAG